MGALHISIKVTLVDLHKTIILVAIHGSTIPTNLVLKELSPPALISSLAQALTGLPARAVTLLAKALEDHTLTILGVPHHPLLDQVQVPLQDHCTNPGQHLQSQTQRLCQDMILLL